MRLDLYNNNWYNPGAGILKRTLWFFCNALFFQSPLNPSSSLKILLLKAFGAKVGIGVTLKPTINIKYPWLLEIGDYVWIGEEVWIDNLAMVKIGNHCCLSQGAMLLTGSHNYKQQTFDLIIKNIILEESVWIGAKSVVCPGVICFKDSVLAVGSIATQNLDSGMIYQGNPAMLKRKR